MRTKIIRIYIITSLLLIAALSYSFFTNLKFRQEVARERFNEDVVSFFNEVCLGGEEGGSRITRKWGSEMRLYIVKDSAYSQQVEKIKEVVKDANKLFSDGFKISLVTDSAKANSYIVLSSHENLVQFPRFGNELGGMNERFFGHFTYNFTKDTITNSVIYVNTGKPFKMQRNAIVEEIVQSLGMGNDTDVYNNSIFFQHKYSAGLDTPTWSKMDEQLIKILYHPKMQVGLNRVQTVPLVNEILEELK
ncbi:DUF2927 domain-containing protein [Mucilaginibacter myungsuensis]|uniref:DUF2927 domain-containing protein n=1 Tax=Mucilaginibacter myungsuensis TaxID=649104 RepID=A0A929KZK2_9SPHI|nr:DUF2927 domain-containing protein [Mucilaginibacter myungsuensis]MBE9661769.1 DUF2927 domain-containing protein [Mucilaginibacter myungsuensis]MDN3599797.1 DUF2927 domain-containing protein [Mucilaginibacter myungsuensis]